MIKWFRKKDDDEKYEVVTSDVPMSTICRWYLYDTDITPDVNELAEMVGLTPISDEGEAKEREDSEARIRHMAPLMPYLEAMADISATALSAMHIREALKEFPEDQQALLDGELDKMGVIYKAVALSTLIGTFSVALDLEIITHNTVSATFLDNMEDDDE